MVIMSIAWLKLVYIIFLYFTTVLAQYVKKMHESSDPTQRLFYVIPIIRRYHVGEATRKGIHQFFIR